MQTAAASSTMRGLGRSAIAFLACGLLLYAALYYAAEQLMRSTGRSNPFFKIATMEQPVADWVILGTSHAMPLDFDGFNALMERETGLRIVNLAATGAGPLYNRFVLEHYLRGHQARNVLFVADSFAFQSRTWNEERFADPKLLARTPRDPAIASRLWQYVRNEGVDFRALVDYATGFSKINNRNRFRTDKWEGEDQFDRVWRASASGVKKRVAYLYPDGASQEALDRYMAEFVELLDAAKLSGATVTVIKLPTPSAFREQLPEEARFDVGIRRAAEHAGVPVHDFSAAIPQARFYFDSDHLNRAGVLEFFGRHLRSVLTGGLPAAPA